MIEWWNSLDAAMKVLWMVTLSSSLIFVVQSVLSFLGVSDSGDGGLDADVETGFSGDGDADGASGHSGVGFLSFRNLVYFCLGFGWTSVLLRDTVASNAVLFLIAAAVGIGLVVCVMLLFKWIGGMQQSGNINLSQSAVDCVGKVYLFIPGERKGQGKVQISINNSVREYDAVTDCDDLPTGTDIKVVEVVNSNTLLVEAINTLVI